MKTTIFTGCIEMERGTVRGRGTGAQGACIVLGVCIGLAACTATTPASGPSAARSATLAGAEAAPMPTYGLRLQGEQAGTTSVSVFVRNEGEEREILADRCTKAEVDRASPDGLLLPIDCDGRRLVLRDEKGRLVMPNARVANAFGEKPPAPTYLPSE